MNTNKLPRILRNILAFRRTWRYKAMIGYVKLWPGMTILDVGCGIDGRSFSDHADTSWNIVGIDLHEPNRIKHNHPHFNYVPCSADDLSRFSDQQFDLLVSVGMLEHITDDLAYAQICVEFQRVAKQFLIVVPYKYAWIEPHYGIPFFGALPASLQISLIKFFNLSGHRNQIDYFLSNFAWRSNATYSHDFGGANVHFLPTLETVAIVKSI